ncbi:MAG: arsenic resistance N-acetyltransferase ArsN2 [Cyclobacteriaceae bacterium]
MIPIDINTSEHLEAFTAQLKTAGLPYEDLSKEEHVLIGYYENEQLIGTGGIEIYENYGLIRSVSISAPNRGKKLGSKIAYHLIDKAKEKDLTGLYLLTETAKDFFLKIGFEVVDRNAVVKPVQASSEFSHVCPVTATCMYLHLQQSC